MFKESICDIKKEDNKECVYYIYIYEQSTGSYDKIIEYNHLYPTNDNVI